MGARRASPVGDPGRTGADNRKTLEGILWVIRTGSPWRDVRETYGKWNAVYQRFRSWEFEFAFTLKRLSRNAFEESSSSFGLRERQM